jgi:uroporphyrin-III C-methyltransferase/precorrin-2 dehydrogenase/sirohydrochlorin ferrochelatase
MDYLPVAVALKDQLCVVVGGNDAAEQKVRVLLGCGARVRVIAAEPGCSLQTLAGDRAEIELIKREWAEEDIDATMAMAIVMAGVEKCGAQVSQAAKRHRVPVYIHDAPDLSTFAFPDIVDRSPVQYSICGLSGAPQPIAQYILNNLETSVPSQFGFLLQFGLKHRAEVERCFPSECDQRDFWDEVLCGHIAELVLRGDQRLASELLQTMLQQRQPTLKAVGEVYLVGAGPGDPDLLTFKALRLIQKCDVLVYDRLISKCIIDKARPGVEKVYVGKAPGAHMKTQKEINALIVEFAKQGKKVCRLKGGDPFVFGRGGEEMQELMEANIPFQVVPGITAACGCASYAGIPLTHRDHAQSVRFVTGHLKDDSADLEWSDLARPHQTVVFYMAMGQLEETCDKLLQYGVPPTRPAAIVSGGTLTSQKIYIADVSTLYKVATQNDVKPPSIIIIGDVVSVRPDDKAHLQRIDSANDIAHS